MKIKAKLILGIGLLFVMITLLTTLSSWFIYQMAGETKNILVANYNTLAYSRNMLIALNKGIENQEHQRLFIENLKKQQLNITEAGEAELTQKLAQDFQLALTRPQDSATLRSIHADITSIMLLNMLAINRKSSQAQATAQQSILWVGFVGAICFIVAFTLLVNLPGNIANPIRELTQSIKGIAALNYQQRVHFENHNEFGELAKAFNTMAEKLQEYSASNLAQLMLGKKRVEALIDNLKDPVIELDQENKILYMNEAALAITGLRQEFVLGKPVQDVAIHNDLLRSLAQSLFEPQDATAPNGPAEPLKIYADHKESYFTTEIIPLVITPTGEDRALQLGNVIHLQNITPYKELDSAKTQFLATISHELKTPIASIQMSLQLLTNEKIGDLNTDQQQLLKGIQEDTARLLAITSELLKLTQLESGSIQLLVTPTPHQEIIDYAIGVNKIAADQKALTITTLTSPKLPLVLADREKTAWVLTNLLSNAIRYSHDRGKIEIEVTPVEHQVKFQVTDFGEGIAPEYQEKIFARYFRAPGSSQEGTGLGLSICKEFIEAQGGTIGVESELGVGSKFFITLPAFLS